MLRRRQFDTFNPSTTLRRRYVRASFFTYSRSLPNTLVTCQLVEMNERQWAIQRRGWTRFGSFPNSFTVIVINYHVWGTRCETKLFRRSGKPIHRPGDKRPVILNYAC